MNLQGLPNETVENPETSRSRLLEVLLIVLSAVLAALLVALGIVYLMKTRSYNRQIKALTESNFGSQSSDINCNIKKLPNTNMFSIEKSNPVMSLHNGKTTRGDLDTHSIISSADSYDFVGLYDSPIFNMNETKDEIKNPLGQKLEDNSSSSYI